MNKVKIFVACHKPCDVLHDDVYTPIHVGRSISDFKDKMGDMIGDDTGDNISDKNPYYSEMTAQYWAWKNVHDCEYIGFCHYRRYFEIDFTNENVDKIFNDNSTDVIVVGPILRIEGRYHYLKNYVCGEDLTILLYTIKRLYPDYYQDVSDYANGYIDYPLNMLVCKKSLFDEYAQWVFSILFECEKRIKLSPYSRAQRVFGYLSEFLMPVYFTHKRCKIKAIKYRLSEANNLLRGGIPKHTLLKAKLSDFIFWGKINKPVLNIDYSIRAGLISDSIFKKEEL